MNLEKRQKTRRAKQIKKRQIRQQCIDGTQDRADTYPRVYGVGPGFPKDRSKAGNTGKRKNPIKKVKKAPAPSML